MRSSQKKNTFATVKSKLIMIQEENTSLNFDPHVSVDCVILGFDGESLKVLLSRQGEEDPNCQYNSLKLPGRLLYANEDLDEAAEDILNQLTGS